MGKHILEEIIGLDRELAELDRQVVEEIGEQSKKIDEVRLFNQAKVLKAMQEKRLSESHFAGSTGYGYGDTGREVTDKIFAQVFGGEDALVRVQMVSGTHALATCLKGVLRPGDTVLSVTGRPYDTLEEVIGIRGNASGNLKEFGINYMQVDLINGCVDYDGIKEKIGQEVKLVFMQRSTGYDWRPALSLKEIEKAIGIVKGLKEDTVCMVDNCYGELSRRRLEPI